MQNSTRKLTKLLAICGLSIGIVSCGRPEHIQVAPLKPICPVQTYPKAATDPVQVPDFLSQPVTP